MKSSTHWADQTAQATSAPVAGACNQQWQQRCLLHLGGMLVAVELHAHTRCRMQSAEDTDSTSTVSIQKSYLKASDSDPKQPPPGRCVELVVSHRMRRERLSCNPAIFQFNKGVSKDTQRVFVSSNGAGNARSHA